MKESRPMSEDEVESKQFLATHDPLTGLANRQLFYNQLEQCMAAAKRYRDCFAVLRIDLDNFQDICKPLTQDQQVQAMRSFGQRLSKCIRSSDLACRLEGDSYSVLLSRLKNPEDIDKVAQTVLDVIAMPLIVDENNYTIQASIGAALHPKHGDEPTVLFQNADAAMQEAKAAGGDRFCVLQQITHIHTYLRPSFKS